MSDSEEFYRVSSKIGDYCQCSCHVSQHDTLVQYDGRSFAWSCRERYHRCQTLPEMSSPMLRDVLVKSLKRRETMR